MAWYNQIFGRLVAAMQAWKQPGELKTTFMGREVEYSQHGLGKSADPQHMTVEDLWATQPHLRTVIDFRARNIAQLGVQLFEANNEQRARVRSSDVASSNEIGRAHV